MTPERCGFLLSSTKLHQCKGGKRRRVLDLAAEDLAAELIDRQIDDPEIGLFHRTYLFALFKIGSSAGITKAKSGFSTTP